MSEASHLAGKSIVITGAAGGFGRLVAEKSAALGARVVCADIDAEALTQLVAQLEEQGLSACAVPTDVTDLAQMQNLAQVAAERYGRIDVWINNAGVMPLAFYADHQQAMPAWDRCIDINIKGVLNGMVAAYDSMIAEGRGHVVNLSSIYGNYPVVGAAVYGATKAAVNFMSESLRVESQGKIKVTIIKPTGVPGTGLGVGIVNAEAIVGILGQNAPRYLQVLQGGVAGELPEALTDANSIEYHALDPEYLADQILYAIDQPWGVSIAELTVRASGDGYIL
ncbi:MAG: SDR family oxidoreductase [Pseudomonadales bacterium]